MNLFWLIIGNLFHPWLSAHFWAAYLIFVESDLYMKKFKLGGEKACAAHFLDYAGEYMDEAMRRYWFRIIFTPWTFYQHPDFDEVSL